MNAKSERSDSEHAASERQLILLLPARERLRHGTRLPAVLANLLGRGDPASPDKPGTDAQLLRYFDILPRGLPVAPITRDLDAGDGRLGAWLRADPAHVRADGGGGRMLACGELGLDADEAETLIAPLRPMFGDEGFPISAPVPERWYLMMPAEVRLPRFSTPEQALGDDLQAHLPPGDDGRRWRRVLNEAQVILHNHPHNAARIRAGKLPVNSLWFWGGGVLPDHVRSDGSRMFSDDLLVRALARLAGTQVMPPQAELLGQGEDSCVVDLRRLRDVAELESPWLEAAVQAVGSGHYAVLRFDFADGSGHTWRSAQRWRFWRRPRHAWP